MVDRWYSRCVNKDYLCCFALFVAASLSAQAPDPSEGDWRAFRGTDGSATSSEPMPVEWNDDKNITWRTPLPGPGAASTAFVAVAALRKT